MHSLDSPASHLPVRVYYEDTDAAGVVYYANYLKYCERARTEWLRALGYAQQSLRETRGRVFVVRSVAAEYLSSAQLDDLLDIETRVTELGRAKLVFAQRVLRDGQPLFEATVTIVCVDWNTRKPASIPADLRSLMESPQ